MDSVQDMMKSVREADVVIIITNHKVYDYAAIIENAKFVFDTRNATGTFGKHHDKVERL
jgi:UDP-N-acetyl-D-glucosamine dehydrogenase